MREQGWQPVFVLCLMICSLMVRIVTSMQQHRRQKRIAFGEIFPSIHTYQVYYFVHIRQTWACSAADEADHDASLGACQEYAKCGGTLIHPEFVLTAAHCILYYEVQLKKTSTGGDLDEWVKEEGSDATWDKATDAWRKFERWITRLIIVPKPKQVVYSNWALYMGSNNMFNMTQKRHVTKVFPHRRFPTTLRDFDSKQKWRETKDMFHDIALLRSCEPFIIKKGQVQVAPMLEDVQELQEQYERIVREGTVCLYVGFGDQEEAPIGTHVAGYPLYPWWLMLHTWRSSECSIDCNNQEVEPGAVGHTCQLCSWHHGPKFGVANNHDSGGPVACEHYFVATMVKAGFHLPTNWTETGSYPLHCVKKSLIPQRLEYYKHVAGNDYHPLHGTKLRRLRTPPD